MGRLTPEPVVTWPSRQTVFGACHNQTVLRNMEAHWNHSSQPRNRKLSQKCVSGTSTYDRNVFVYTMAVKYLAEWEVEFVLGKGIQWCFECWQRMPASEAEMGTKPVCTSYISSARIIWRGVFEYKEVRKWRKGIMWRLVRAGKSEVPKTARSW